MTASGSLGKVLVREARGPEFEPGEPQKHGRREATPRSCPLTSTCVSWNNQQGRSLEKPGSNQAWLNDVVPAIRRLKQEFGVQFYVSSMIA